MSNMRTRNLLAGITMLLLCAGYAYLTANLPSRDIQNSTQPSFFPWVIVGCMSLLSFTLMVQGLIPRFNREILVPSDIASKRMAIALLLAIAYMIALPWLGFVAANIFLFAGLTYLYGEVRPLWIVVSSILISVFVFMVFREVFQIRLTAGILEGLFR